MKKIFILILLATHLQSYSQQMGFRQGLIITQSSDTIICLVPIASSFGKNVPIKRSAESDEELFPLEKIKYMATATNVYENVTYKKKEKDVHKLMWLVVEGTMNLYQETEIVIKNTKYQTNGSMTSFGKPNQTYVIKKQDTTYLIEEKNFIETITPLISDNEVLFNKVKTKVYKYEDIATVVKEYDGITGTENKHETPRETDYIPATSILFSDSVYQKVKINCDDKIFTNVETLPSIKGGQKALSDSLLLYLKQLNSPLKGKATFTFLVTVNSELLDLAKISGNIPAENDIKSGLLAYSNMWLPAVQYSKNVCAAVRLQIEFRNGEIIMDIL